jgi:hypothetical protein
MAKDFGGNLFCVGIVGEIGVRERPPILGKPLKLPVKNRYTEKNH